MDTNCTISILRHISDYFNVTLRTANVVEIKLVKDMSPHNCAHPHTQTHAHTHAHAHAHTHTHIQTHTRKSTLCFILLPGTKYTGPLPMYFWSKINHTCKEHKPCKLNMMSSTIHVHVHACTRKCMYTYMHVHDCMLIVQ